MTALTPDLTPRDKQVLDAVPRRHEQGTRARHITAKVVAKRGRKSPPTADEREEVEQILRGLEAIGLVRQAGGWWQRVR